MAPIPGEGAGQADDKQSPQHRVPPAGWGRGGETGPGNGETEGQGQGQVTRRGALPAEGTGGSLGGPLGRVLLGHWEESLIFRSESGLVAVSGKGHTLKHPRAKCSGWDCTRTRQGHQMSAPSVAPVQGSLTGWRGPRASNRPPARSRGGPCSPSFGAGGGAEGVSGSRCCPAARTACSPATPWGLRGPAPGAPRGALQTCWGSEERPRACQGQMLERLVCFYEEVSQFLQKWGLRQASRDESPGPRVCRERP